MGALILLAAAIARSSSQPGAAIAIEGIAAGLGIVGVTVVAIWLPPGLSLREARKRTREELVLVVGDQSIAAAAATWRSTDLVKIPRPSTYAVIELASEFLGIWAEGMAAERIATCPGSAIVSVTLEHGPFHTTFPISYLSVQLAGETPEIRFAVIALGPLKTMSRERTASFGEALSRRFSVPPCDRDPGSAVVLSY